MSATHEFTVGHLPAIVSRGGALSGESERYLVLCPDGRSDWTSDPQCATAFVSMREAARMAFRLPANLKAYGLPLSAEAFNRSH
jgi:hypothetical protein